MRSILLMLALAIYLLASGCSAPRQGMFGAGYKNGDFSFKAGKKYRAREHVGTLTEAELRDVEALLGLQAPLSDNRFSYTVISGWTGRAPKSPGKGVFFYLNGKSENESWRLALQMKGDKISEVYTFELPSSEQVRDPFLRSVEALRGHNLRGLDDDPSQSASPHEKDLYTQARLALALWLTTDLKKAFF